MAGLSQDQIETRDALKKSATITGAIVGVIVGLLLLWILGGQGAALRFGGAIVVGGAVGVLVSRASFNAKAKDAKCAACGAAFSRSRTDRAETLVASAPKEERAEQDDGSVKVTTWTEETYDVAETFTCANSGDAAVETHQTTRRKDEETVTEPAPAPTGWAQSAPEGEGADEAADPAPEAPKPGRSSRSRGRG